MTQKASKVTLILKNKTIIIVFRAKILTFFISFNKAIIKYESTSKVITYFFVLL